MTRSARAVEARAPTRTAARRRRRRVARRRGGGGVAIFPRPDRVGEFGFAVRKRCLKVRQNLPQNTVKR